MPRSTPMSPASPPGSSYLRRLVCLSSWLLLALLTALTLGPQLGCGTRQSAEGAGGQSGDEGLQGPVTPPR